MLSWRDTCLRGAVVYVRTSVLAVFVVVALVVGFVFLVAVVVALVVVSVVFVGITISICSISVCFTGIIIIINTIVVWWLESVVSPIDGRYAADIVENVFPSATEGG